MPTYLGQHFLKNVAVTKKIVAALDMQSGETIIEIGPGHGELTIPLAAEAKRIKNVNLVAVERDKNLAEALALKISEVSKIINEDILEFLKDGLPAQTGNASFKLVGNIPYYLTGHLFRIVSELEKKPARIVFMIQKEVAERICAQPPRMNRLAASVQFWAQPKIIASVPRADFSPPPEVDSAVIMLETRQIDKKSEQVDAENYYTAVRTLFAQPRKTIFNNLGAKIPKNEVAPMLAELKIDPKLRPQDLTIENIIEIASVHK